MTEEEKELRGFMVERCSNAKQEHHGDLLIDAVLRVERKRSEQAEREIGLWRAETGAGKPEDAGAAIRHTREDLRQAELRAERAEADNAALLDLIMRAADVFRDMAGMPIEADFLSDTAAEKHPGAALLERLRALEKVREACEPWVRRYGQQGKPPYTHEGIMLAACASADALKGKP